MLSIIIPAHNEETVIARGISVMIAGAEPGELEVVVACNGCTDRTAEIARSFGGPVRVIEIETPSKVAALNAADQVSTGFPRFYVDADVLLPLDAIRRMAAALEAGKGLAAWPEPKTDLSAATWPVKAFYAAWLAMPYNRDGGRVGTGVYAVSREGRERFGNFPQIINDDGFVRYRFTPAERVTVEGAYSIVEAPRTLESLIRVKTRVRVGQYQLRERFPTAPAADRKSVADLARTFLPRPWLWPCVAIYAAITLLVKQRARRQFMQSGTCAWGKDVSTRVPALVDGSPAAGRRKVLAVASGGGHWVQLLRLRPAFENCDLVFVTVSDSYRSQVRPHRFYRVNDATRWNKAALILMLLKIVRIMLKERPDVVVSTGAAPGYFALAVGRLLKSRTIWIDSVANAEELSASGQKVHRFADLWLTQWPHLAKPEGPLYAGAVL